VQQKIAALCTNRERLLHTSNLAICAHSPTAGLISKFCNRYSQRYPRFIRQWKLNRALYHEYGGRIIYQQGGPEPLDAYRAFLEDREKEGAFRILDKYLESEFWRYYTTDSIHAFYPAGSQEEMQAFESPWWLSENPPQWR